MVQKLIVWPDAEEILLFEEFLNPSVKNLDTTDPDLDHIIIKLSGEDIDDDSAIPDKECIFGLRPEVPSEAVILRHLSDLSL